MKRNFGIFLMVLSSICACVGQLFWKLASSEHKFPLLIFGFAVYGLGALLMVIAYRFGKLSVLQPILALNYVLSIFLAVFILKEQITIFKCLGILVIITGVFCVTIGDIK